MNLTWRTRRLINNATADDINKILSMDCWHGEALERLARRVEASAHEDPPNGYLLALRCLLFLANRVDDDDLQARALTAAGAAARRLGRAGEAAQLYERARQYTRSPRTRARLFLCIAVLAREESRYEAAFEAIESARSQAVGLVDIESLAASVRGTVYLERGRELSRSIDLIEAIRWLSISVSSAEPGSVGQISALVNLAASLEANGHSFDLRQVQPMLERIRFKARHSRTKGVRRASAYVDWIEGRLVARLGSTRAGIRRMRKAGRAFARLGFHVDAIRIAADILECGAEHGAEGEAFEHGSDVVVLIPKDSPQKPALEIFNAFELGADASNWAADVRAALVANG